MKATIKDVAREAGVSISTVSYAINGNDRISDETRQHVLAVAKQLNYVANGNAKMLKQKKTRAIGLFFNSWFGPIYSEIVRGIEQGVHAKGYDLLACSLYGAENSTAYKYLRDQMVDGAIILTHSFDDQFLQSVASSDLPLVVLDREIRAPHIYSILIDNFGGAFTATQALIKSGCEEVYFFSGPADSYDNQKRQEGYIAALGFSKIPINPDFIITSDFTEEGGFEQMTNLLKSGVVPRGIFAGNDEMALGIIRAARHYGLLIPDDLKLIGFDNIREAALAHPPLTTVTHHKREMGLLAANTLFSAMANDETTDMLKIIPTTLITRDTI